MTEKGELVTLNGEFGNRLNGVLSFNENIGISYSMNIDHPGNLEVKMHCPVEQTEVYQMIFVLKGSVKIENKNYRLRHNALLANQHNLHRVAPGNTILTTGVNDEVMAINLDRSFVNKYLPAGHPVREQLAHQQKTEPQIMVFAQNMPITNEINAVLKQFSQAGAGSFSYQLMMELKALELLTLQLLQYEQWGSTDTSTLLGNNKRERVEKVRDIIIAHKEQQLSLKTLAHMVGTNEFDLKKDFKVVFGNTVYGYLKQYKMEQAKSMLANTAMSVAEISQKMGYKHATHFTSAFKKHFGYLPNKLRALKIICIMLVQDFTVVVDYLDVLFAI